MSRQLQVVLDLDSSSYTSKMGTASTVTKNFGSSVKEANTHVGAFSGSLDESGHSAGTALTHLRDYVLTIAGMEAIFSSLGHAIGGAMEKAVEMSAQLERQTLLMKGLSQASTEAGKLAEAQQDMASLFDMAKKSGYSVNDLANAFVRLKSTGMDPMQGSMQSMVDAVAAFGGNSNTLNHVALALQEMADKGTLSMKELRRQFAIFVPDGMRTMAEVLGLTMDEMQKKIASGAVAARPAMELMLRQLGIVHAGAAEKMAQTFEGMKNTFDTNLIQMSQSFTGENTKDVNSLYATIKSVMGEINSAMTSNEGKNAFRTMGNDMAVVVRVLADLARFLIQYRTEVIAVGEAMAFVFSAKLIAAWGTDIVNMLGRATAATRAWFSSEADSVPTATQLRIQNNIAILEGVRANQSLLDSTRELMAIQAEEAAQQEEYARLQLAEVNQELEGAAARVEALTAQQEARVRLVETMAVEEAAALRQLQTGRSVTGQYVNQTVALQEYNAAVSRLSTANTMLARTDAELAAAESQVRTAAEARAATMGIVTTATEAAAAADAAFMAAETAATAEITLFDMAAAGATIAVDALSTAVKFALGPWGLLIGIVLTAANAMGVFTSKADEAAAAADRAKHHMAEEGDEAKLEGQASDLQSRINDLQSRRGADGSIMQRGASTNGMGSVYTVPKAEVDKELADLKDQLNSTRASQKTLLNDYWDGVASDAGSAARKGVTSFEERMYQADAGVRASIAKVKDPEERQKQSQRLDMAEQVRLAGAQQEQIKNLEAQRKGMKNNTLQAQALDAQIGSLRHEYDQASASSLQLELAHGTQAKGAKAAAGAISHLGEQAAVAEAKQKGLGTTLAKVNYDIAHGVGAYKSMSDAQKEQARSLAATIDATKQAMHGLDPNKSFDNKLESAAGKIAELKAKLVDGNTAGELAKFNAELAAGMFKGVTDDRINQMREYAKILDGLNKSSKVQDFGNKLSEDLSKATTNADELWKSFENGTMHADKTSDRLRASLTAAMEALHPGVEKAKELQGIIDQIVQETEQAKFVDLLESMKTSSEKTEFDLMPDGPMKNNAEFKQSVHDMFAQVVAANNSINANDRDAAAKRKQLWDGYFRWYADQEKKTAKENQSALVTQAEDWSNLGKNLQQAYASIAGSFVDMLSSGKLDVKQFAVEILKEIAKVIIEALIAYAILSAIGMTPQGAGGQKMNFGQFMGSQVSSSFGSSAANSVSWAPKHHTGGIIGQDTGLGGLYASSLWDNAPRFHNGGIIGLQPNEVPIIGLKGEKVLTEDEQKQMGQAQAGPAPVAVNIVNNGSDATAEASSHWDGKQTVVNIVLEAMGKQGPLRDAMQSTLKK